MSSPLSRNEIIQRLRRADFSEGEARYLNHHAQRFADTLALLEPLITKPSFRLLDVGPHLLTALVAEHFRSLPIHISTLGWWNERCAPADLANNHLEWDLNIELPAEAFPAEGFDGILMAETIEHLHTSPKIVLRAIARHLKPDGWLVVQTPNAVALSKRLKLLFGSNPYELIRENPHDPGHFREYTMDELIAIGQASGLKATHSYYANYWRSQGWKGRLEDFRPSLRNGLMVVFKKVSQL